jgi:hypothetical protein
MLYVKIATVFISAGLFFIGGWKWHNARRFIMPCVITGMSFWITHNWWALTMLASMGFLCLGYGDKSPLRHIFGDNWGRGIWGLLVAISLSIGLFLTHSLQWFWFIGYLGLNFTLEPALKKIYQFIGDPIIGAGMASIVFLI